MIFSLGDFFKSSAGNLIEEIFLIFLGDKGIGISSKFRLKDGDLIENNSSYSDSFKFLFPHMSRIPKPFSFLFFYKP